MSKIGAVILSRQQIRPSLRNSWVKNSIEAVKWLKNNDYCVMSSVGMSTWEMVTSLAVQNDIPLKLVLPCTDEYNFNQQIDYYSYEFKIRNKPVEFTPLLNDENSDSNIWQQRDNYILNNADILLPVSIRKNGFFDSNLKNHNIKINNDFLTEYHDKSDSFSYTISEDEINPELLEINFDYICHWTRTSITRWPDETLFDYYTAVSMFENYPRSAFETLKRIIKSNEIIASSKNIEQKQSVVSFSGCSLLKLSPLIRWRSRYQQMSFEPYGIGIERQTSLSIGVKPVKYYDRNGNDDLESTPAWQLQSNGIKSDWTKEDEYRYHGNFDLSMISDNKKFIICRFKKEADELHQLTGLKSIAFTDK